MPIGVDHLRRYAVARSLFAPTSLRAALQRFGFVQADPIRAPARAQDLIMRHRVDGYRAGDLERHYPRLAIEEDVFINYGFVTSEVHALMHPRRLVPAWPLGKTKSERLLAFVRERGTVHPREADDHFGHGTVTNYWGGSSHTTTHLLDALHYRGLLRVAGRKSGVRLYAARQWAAQPLEDDGHPVADSAASWNARWSGCAHFFGELNGGSYQLRLTAFGSGGADVVRLPACLLTASRGLALGVRCHRSIAFNGTSWTIGGSCTSMRSVAAGVSASSAQPC